MGECNDSGNSRVSMMIRRMRLISLVKRARKVVDETKMDKEKKMKKKEKRNLRSMEEDA